MGVQRDCRSEEDRKRACRRRCQSGGWCRRACGSSRHPLAGLRVQAVQKMRYVNMQVGGQQETEAPTLSPLPPSKVTPKALYAIFPWRVVCRSSRTKCSSPGSACFNTSTRSGCSSFGGTVSMDRSRSMWSASRYPASSASIKSDFSGVVFLTLSTILFVSNDTCLATKRATSSGLASFPSLM